MGDTCICRSPKGSRRVPVLSRPWPGIVVIKTPLGPDFSITHELTGKALAFFPTQTDAEGACRFLETLDWTIPKAAMTKAHVDAVRQVQWSAQMILMEALKMPDDQSRSSLPRGTVWTWCPEHQAKYASDRPGANGPNTLRCSTCGRETTWADAATPDPLETPRPDLAAS